MACAMTIRVQLFSFMDFDDVFFFLSFSCYVVGTYLFVANITDDLGSCVT